MGESNRVLTCEEKERRETTCCVCVCVFQGTTSGKQQENNHEDRVLKPN